jgi:hypothetical protein
MSRVDVTRAALGGMLVARPYDVLVAVRTPSDPMAVAYTRVLGARHLAQALLALWRSGPGLRYGAAAVDGLHALSAIALAARSRRHRRGLVANAATAGVFALADVAAAGAVRGDTR